MFVGRVNEMQDLNEAYESQTFQAVIIYGRRRIGKTFLINQFVSDKPHIAFTAQEANDKINLQLFTDKVLAFFHMENSGVSFKTWNAVLDFLADRAGETQFVLSIDEFPYACNANRALRSIFQNAIDTRLKDTKLFLILCGSHVAFMEKEVLGYKSPLFGRRTMQICLKGFDYFNAAEMLEPFSNEDKIKLYACIGGTPHYLAQVHPNLSFMDNIKRLYFNNSGYLYSEPFMLLQQELREPAIYNSIISAIASGALKLNDIVMRIGEEKTKVMKYISTLLQLQIIERQYPFGDHPERSRKSIYQISDFCYRFWYRFVFGNQNEIDSGLGALFADQIVSDDALANFIGKPAFESICLDWLKRLNMERKLPFLACNFGKWWGNDPVKREETDLDIVLGNKEQTSVIIGECKWKNNPADQKDILEWMNKTYLLPTYSDRYYIYFSKGGYTEGARLLEAHAAHLLVLTVNDLFYFPEAPLFSTK